MDKQQVNVLRLQFAQTFIDALCGILFARIADPHFGHEEQVLTLDSALAPGIANTLLVLVSLCRVNQTVANAQCITDAAFTLIRTHQKDSIAQSRHLNTVT